MILYSYSSHLLRHTQCCINRNGQSFYTQNKTVHLSVVLLFYFYVLSFNRLHNVAWTIKGSHIPYSKQNSASFCGTLHLLLSSFYTMHNIAWTIMGRHNILFLKHCIIQWYSSSTFVVFTLLATKNVHCINYIMGSHILYSVQDSTSAYGMYACTTGSSISYKVGQ